MSNNSNDIWESNISFGDENKAAAARPIWTLESLEPGEELLQWAEARYSTELKRWRDYRMNALRNLALYKGHFNYQGKNSNSLNQIGYKQPKPAKLTVNYLQDLVTQKVSRAIKNKPSVIISPANNEYTDKVAAKIVKAWVDYQLYKQDFDGMVTKVLTAAFIMGEAYITTCWDTSAGELHPDWKKAVRDAKTTKTKPQVTIDDGGTPLVIDSPYYVGDVAFQDRTPLNTLIELCGRFEKANYVIMEDLEDLDELRYLYPKQESKLTADDNLESWAGCIDVPHGELQNKVLVRTMYWKGSEFLPEGRYVRWTKSTVLESRALPEHFPGLPITRFTDIDVPNEQRGMSFFQHARNLNAAVNDLTTIGRRNAVMMGSPKWIVPRGSKIKREALGNDISLIEYDGSAAPQILAPPPMSTEPMLLRQQLLTDMQNTNGANQWSQQDQQVEVRSALQMQVMDEQDEQRANSGVAKYSSLIRESVKAALCTAASYYEPEDARLLPIVGKDNSPELKEFDITHLTRDYDIRVTSNTGLPSGKGQRAKVLAELKEAFPTAIRDEFVIEMLQYGNSESYYDMATAAVKAVQAENESVLSGDDLADPMPYEGLVTHWTGHVAAMQARSYKTSVPPEQQQKLEVHALATEDLMLETARKNPAFAIEICKLPGFPLFFTPSEQDCILLDRARLGTPLSLSEVKVLYETGLPPAPPGMAPPAGGIVQGGNLGGAGGETGGRPPKMDPGVAVPEGVPTSSEPQAPADEPVQPQLPAR